MMRKYLSLFLSLLVLAGIIQSCKKTEDLPAQPQSRILSYKVTNLPDTAIYAAIDDIDRTITVYLPFYYGLNVIDPEIVVSDGAVIKEEILPVMVDDSTVTYTVNGKDKSTAVYKLVIALQSPREPLQLRELSGEGNIAVTYPGYSQFSFSGSFLSTSTTYAKAWLVNEEGAESPVTPAAISISVEDNQTWYYMNGITVPPTLDSGLYYVKASSYGRTATLQYPIRVSYKQPNYAYFTTRDLKQGDSFVLAASVNDGSVFTDVATFSVSADGETWLPLELVSYERTEASIKIPDNFPPGVYNRYKMTFATWPDRVNQGSSLTVTAK